MEKIKAKETLSLFSDRLEQYILTLSFIEFPFLALPVIKQIYSAIISRIIKLLENEGKIHIDFIAIDAEISSQKEQYNKTIIELKEVLASNTMSEEAKHEYLQEAKKKLRDIIRMSTR